MKTKRLSYQITFYSWIGIFLMIIYLTLTSCATQKMPYEQSKKTWNCSPKKKYKPKKVRASYEKSSFIHHPGSFN